MCDEAVNGESKESLKVDEADANLTSKLGNPNYLYTPPAPIKVVDKPLLRQCYMKVVKGEGRVTATVAAPFLKGKGDHFRQDPDKAWNVLFDSGSDGDIVFVTKAQGKRLNTQTKLREQVWHTSVGAFSTKRIASVDLTFPDFNQSKRMNVQPDVKYIDKDGRVPTYNLIIGIETMMK